MTKHKHSIGIWDVLFIVFLVIFIAAIAAAAVIQIYMWTHVKGAFLMGSDSGYSLFEIRYLYKRVPKAVIAAFIDSFVVLGSFIGLIISAGNK